MKYRKNNNDRFDLIMGLAIVFITGMIVGGWCYYGIHKSLTINHQKVITK